MISSDGEDVLQAMLRACYEMERCRKAGYDRKTDFDFGAIMGELDWHCEFYRLAVEVGAIRG